MIVTNLVIFLTKLVPNFFCLMLNLFLVQICNNLGLTLCQFQAKFFLMDFISAFDVDLAQTWLIFVPNLCETFLASYKFYAWRGFATSSLLLCANFTLNAKISVQCLHLAQMRHKSGTSFPPSLSWVWICVIWQTWDKPEDEFGPN